MELEQKAKIIEEFVRDFFNSPELYDSDEMKDFIIYNDLGVPMAQGLIYELIEDLTQEGETLIQETWENLCGVFDADPDDEYETLDDVVLYDEDLE
jgi:hypothetical protein